MDKTGENTQAATSSGDQKVKFSNSFTPEIDKYIIYCRKASKKPSVAGFAQRIGTDENSIHAWATKKRKDDKGNLTDQLARPNFHAALQRLIELEKTHIEKKKSKDKNPVKTSADIRQELREEKLNARQELFCQLYAKDREFFGNGVQTYIEVYEPDQKKPNWYNAACSAASQILSNTKVINRINEILEECGLNDAAVDKQLAFLITQHADFTNKLGAIKEYNKVRQRITEKIDHTSKGEQIQVVELKYVTPDKPDGTSNTDNQTDL